MSRGPLVGVVRNEGVEGGGLGGWWKGQAGAMEETEKRRYFLSLCLERG